MILTFKASPARFFLLLCVLSQIHLTYSMDTAEPESLLSLVKKHPVLAVSAGMGYAAIAGAVVYFGDDYWIRYKNKKSTEVTEKCKKVILNSINAQEIMATISQAKKHSNWLESHIDKLFVERFRSAIQNNNVDVVKICLDATQSPYQIIYAPYYNQGSAIELALRIDNPEIVMLLRGSKPAEQKTFDDEPFLLTSAKNKAWRTVAHLLRSGVDCNIQSKSGKTALHYAVKFQDSESLAHLVAYGADVNARDSQDRTPLHLVAEECLICSKPTSEANIMPILESSAFEYQPELHEKLLSAMVGAVNVSAVARLLTLKGNQAQKSEPILFTLQSPIFKAIIKGSEEILSLLLEHDPTLVEAQVDTGLTPLILAAERGQVGALKILLDCRRAQVNALKIPLNQPLMSAIHSNQFFSVQLLLEELERYGDSTQAALKSLAYSITCGGAHIASCTIERFKKNSSDHDGRDFVDHNGNSYWHMIASREFDEGLTLQLLSWYEQKPDCLSEYLISRNNADQTPLGVAYQSKNIKMINFFKALDAKYS